MGFGSKLQYISPTNKECRPTPLQIDVVCGDDKKYFFIQIM